MVSIVSERSLFPFLIETDLKVVQQQLTGAVGLNSFILGRLYDDVYGSLETILVSKLCHTKRQANIEAPLLPHSSFLTRQDLIGLIYL